MVRTFLRLVVVPLVGASMGFVIGTLALVLDSLRTRLAHFSSLSHAGRNADMVAKRLRR